MIYPRLNRVRNGQRLSVELVNGLIKRTEYAGDLLRQGKCLAGTNIGIDAKYTGTILTATAVNKYFGYILPLVPSVNDILLEEDVPVTIGEAGAIGGLFARDLPLNQRQKIVYPEIVNSGGYALRISGAFWANFNFAPDGRGLYPSVSAPNLPSSTLLILNTSDPFFVLPALGPHPNFTNIFSGNPEAAWFGGSITLIKL